jgi:hypothetical protein
MLFNFALDYAARKVEHTQVGLKLTGTYQLLAYADDMNRMGNHIVTTKKNTENVIDGVRGWSGS